MSFPLCIVRYHSPSDPQSFCCQGMVATVPRYSILPNSRDIQPRNSRYNIMGWKLNGDPPREARKRLKTYMYLTHKTFRTCQKKYTWSSNGTNASTFLNYVGAIQLYRCCKKSFTIVFQMLLCGANVMKIFTLKEVQTIHRSTSRTTDSFYVFKCKYFRNTRHKVIFEIPL
jgi:hypothetical protein